MRRPAGSICGPSTPEPKQLGDNRVTPENIIDAPYPLRRVCDRNPPAECDPAFPVVPRLAPRGTAPDPLRRDRRHHPRERRRDGHHVAQSRSLPDAELWDRFCPTPTEIV